MRRRSTAVLGLSGIFSTPFRRRSAIHGDDNPVTGVKFKNGPLPVLLKTSPPMLCSNLTHKNSFDFSRDTHAEDWGKKRTQNDAKVKKQLLELTRLWLLLAHSYE